MSNKYAATSLWLGLIFFCFQEKVLAQNSFESVAVVELFTSQGCSSCPPADRLLAETIAQSKKSGQKVYALSFHVDYWNRLGWTDVFSQKKFTERQYFYSEKISGSSVYTPQTVVSGTQQLVGSDKKELDEALKKALKNPASVEIKNLKATFDKNKKATIQYELNGDFSDCEIHFALLSLEEITAVKRGENGGRTLKNSHVVREFITRKAEKMGSVGFDNSPVSEPKNTSVFAYVQRLSDAQIVGATSFDME